MKKYLFRAVWLFIAMLFLVVKPVKAEKTLIEERLTTKDYLVKKVVIYNVLSRYDSPLKKETDSFMKACMSYKINCYLLPSISGLESTFGKAYLPGTYNPFGWGSGLIAFKSWEDCFMNVAQGLRNNYMDKGALTISEIAPIYAASPTWAKRVSFFFAQFEKEEESVTKSLLL